MKHDDIDGLKRIANSQKSKTVKANDTIKANDTVTIDTNHFQLAKECALCGEDFLVPDIGYGETICPKCKELRAIIRKHIDRRNVELIHCKDCEHFITDEEGYVGECDWWRDYTVFADDYCSYAVESRTIKIIKTATNYIDDLPKPIITDKKKGAQ